jgi:hypothetical protein
MLYGWWLGFRGFLFSVGFGFRWFSMNLSKSFPNMPRKIFLVGLDGNLFNEFSTENFMKSQEISNYFKY